MSECSNTPLRQRRLHYSRTQLFSMQYALVTGGSRGIGRAICLRLSQAGWSILINYVSNEAAARETLALIEAQGGSGELFPCDMADPKAIETAVESWENAHPSDSIEVLVNNAGIRHDNLLIFMPDTDWHSVLDTTLNGFFYLTRRVLKGMMTQRKGRIINISSLSGVKGLAGQVNYSAAKAALIGATKALAQEVGPRGITVNAIAPGFITSDMTAELDEKELRKLVPLRRFGTADEVAALTAFLASDDAAYITGEVININGGLHT